MGKNISPCQNSSKILLKNRRKRQNRIPLNTQIHDRSLSWLGSMTTNVTLSEQFHSNIKIVESGKIGYL